jgi:branched-chain amino acid transport system permease protein
MRGRPLLKTSYSADASLLPSTTKRVALVVLIVAIGFAVLGNLPGVTFLGDAKWTLVIATVCVFAIGALGLNILTGLCGQVSLGHAFFMGVGAYAGVVLGGKGVPGRLWGLDLPIWLWLPGAGVVAALVGIIVSPAAVRLRGLYLGIVTLGLVFLGDHLFRNLDFICGSPGIGRQWPNLDIRLWKEEKPLLNLSTDGQWFGIDITGTQKQVFFLLFLVGILSLLARNIARTRVGRALAAIRDRDIAAEVMGVAEAKYKLIAFALSSFYAGMAGALFGAIIGTLIPEYWSLVLSVEFVAILIIGGAGTITGVLLGSVFVVGSEELIVDFTTNLAEKAAGPGFHPFADFVMKVGRDDFGLLSIDPTGPGLAVNQFTDVFYGALIILFLLFEPLGLYGIWTKVRNYWKGWPFTY